MEQITKEELLDVIGKFELGNHIEVVSVEPYGSGHINDTFRLEVKEDGKEKLYILQRMNKDIFKNQKELMDNILQVTSFLTEKIKEQGGDPNRETLQVIPTKEGKAYLTEENGDGWRVYPFITDSLSFDKADTPEAMKKSGYAFGNFQYLLSDFPGKTIGQLDIRKKYNINIMALKTNDIMNLKISSDTQLLKNSTMLVLGEKKHIQKCFHI